MNISPEWPASNVPEMGEEGVGYQKGATVAELAQPLFGLKAGRETFNRPVPEVFRPLAAAAE